MIEGTPPGAGVSARAPTGATGRLRGRAAGVGPGGFVALIGSLMVAAYGCPPEQQSLNVQESAAAADECTGANGPTLRFQLLHGTSRAVLFDGSYGGPSCVVNRVCSDVGDIRLPAGASLPAACGRRRLFAFAPDSMPRLLEGPAGLPTEPIALAPPKRVPVRVWIVADPALGEAIKQDVIEQLASAEAAYLDLATGVALAWDEPSIVTSPSQSQLIGNACEGQWDLAAQGAQLGVYEPSGINVYVVSRIGNNQAEGLNCRGVRNDLKGPPHPEIVFLAYSRILDGETQVANWWTTELVAHETGHGLGPMTGWWDHVEGYEGFDVAVNLMNGGTPPEVREITLGQIYRFQFAGTALVPTLTAGSAQPATCSAVMSGAGSVCPPANLMPPKPWLRP